MREAKASGLQESRVYRYRDSNPGFRRERALVGLMTSADVVHLQAIPQNRRTPADVKCPADVCQECVRDPRNQSFDGLAAEQRGRTAVSPDWPESQRRTVPARAWRSTRSRRPT